MIYILAENFNQACNYCMFNNIQVDLKRVQIVTNLDSLRGSHQKLSG